MCTGRNHYGCRALTDALDHVGGYSVNERVILYEKADEMLVRGGCAGKAGCGSGRFGTYGGQRFVDHVSNLRSEAATSDPAHYAAEPVTRPIASRENGTLRRHPVGFLLLRHFSKNSRLSKKPWLSPGLRACCLVGLLVAGSPCSAGPEGARFLLLSVPNGELRAYVAPAHGADLAGLEVRHDGRWSELLYCGMDYRPTGGWTGKAPILWPAVGRNFPGRQGGGLGWVFQGKRPVSPLKPLTRTHKLIARPNGQSELYDCARDPGLRHNLFGESSVASVQAALQARLLNWYINTSGIAPMDKDGRDPPPYYPTPSFVENERALLDH